MTGDASGAYAAPPHDPRDARFCYCGAGRGHFGWQRCEPKPMIEAEGREQPSFENVLADPLYQAGFDHELLPHLIVERCRCAAVHIGRCADTSDSRAVGGGAAGTRAVPPGPPAPLRTSSDGHGLAAVVADLPQLDGSVPSVSERDVGVAAVGAGAVGEVVQFEDCDPAAGGGVAVEGHVTNGGSETSQRQVVAPVIPGPCPACGDSEDACLDAILHGSDGGPDACCADCDHPPTPLASGRSDTRGGAA